MREARTEDAAARFRSLMAFCSPDGLSVTRGAAAPATPPPPPPATAAPRPRPPGRRSAVWRRCGCSRRRTAAWPEGARGSPGTAAAACRRPSRRRARSMLTWTRGERVGDLAAADGDGGAGSRPRVGEKGPTEVEASVLREATAASSSPPAVALRDAASDEGGAISPGWGAVPPSPAAARLPAPPPARATAASNLSESLAKNFWPPSPWLPFAPRAPPPSRPPPPSRRRGARRPPSPPPPSPPSPPPSRPPPPPRPPPSPPPPPPSSPPPPDRAAPSRRRAAPLLIELALDPDPAHTFQTRAPSTTV